MILPSEIQELIEVLQDRANHNRGLSEQTRHARIREYHAGKADGCDGAVKCLQALIAAYRPKPVLRVVASGGGEHV